MIEFSWEKLNSNNSYNMNKVISSILLDEELPIGHSFIINLSRAVKNIEEHNLLYDYIYFCAVRSIFDYKFRGITYIPTYKVSKEELARVELNPHIEVINDNIYLKYEQEITHVYN